MMSYLMIRWDQTWRRRYSKSKHQRLWRNGTKPRSNATNNGKIMLLSPWVAILPLFMAHRQFICYTTIKSGPMHPTRFLTLSSPKSTLPNTPLCHLRNLIISIFHLAIHLNIIDSSWPIIFPKWIYIESSHVFNLVKLGSFKLQLLYSTST